MAAYEQFLRGRISAKSDRGKSNLINEFLGYIDGQVTQWYSGSIYSYPLANRAIGYMRNEAALFGLF